MTSRRKISEMSSFGRSLSAFLSRPLTPRLLALDLAICTVALVAALAVFWAAGETPDWLRFFDQAKSIASGDGFRTEGRLETYLPPGYSVLVAILLLFGLEDYVRGVQLVMHTLTVFLVYAALVQVSRAWALILAVLYALNPLAAR
jgi:hypothetical protein